MLKTLKKNIEPCQNYTGTFKTCKDTGQTSRSVKYQMLMKRQKTGLNLKSRFERKSV